MELAAHTVRALVNHRYKRKENANAEMDLSEGCTQPAVEVGGWEPKNLSLRDKS